VLVPVTRYAHLPPPARPPAHCPVCLERVSMKLGGLMRHHYAHRPGSTCAASTGEGALHLAAKLHLADRLARATAIEVEHRCAGAATDRASGGCSAVEREIWSVRWDEVSIEHDLSGVRADILLLAKGAPAAAIEVRVSNPVDAERAARYARLSLSWLEVPAGEVVGSGDGWSPEMPLPLSASSRFAVQGWRCQRHQRLHDAWVDEQRNGEHPLFRRYVHVYRADSGLRSAERRCSIVPLAIVERRSSGRTISARLEREDTGTTIGRALPVGDAAEARASIHRAFLAWARWMRNGGAVLDSPMPWLAADSIPRPPAARHFPERLRWDEHEATFVGSPNRPALAWPSVEGPGADPDPVLGRHPCFWSALAQRDRPAELNAIVNRVWLVLRPLAWVVDGVERTRASVECFVHRGERWESIGTIHTREFAVRDAGSPWHDRLRPIAESVADAIASGQERRPAIRAVVERAAGLAPEIP
jgi:hypothetical protein